MSIEKWSASGGSTKLNKNYRAIAVSGELLKMYSVLLAERMEGLLKSGETGPVTGLHGLMTSITMILMHY